MVHELNRVDSRLMDLCNACNANDGRGFALQMTFSGMKEQVYDENCNQDEDSYDQSNGLRVYVNRVMIRMGVHHG